MELQPIYEKLQIQEMNQMQKSTYQASENEQDIILLSPTGSGKTLAFLFPVLRNLQKIFLEFKRLFWFLQENWHCK
jgi:superfamily II DNA/RNA helicase